MSRICLSFLLPLGVFLGLAALGAVALYGTLSGSRTPDQLPSVLIGKSAPPLNLPRLVTAKSARASAAQVTIEPFRGKPLLVNIFASWCAPCRAEAPALEMLSKRIAILGIAYKDREEDTQQFLGQYGDPFRAIGIDRDGRAGIARGFMGFETFLLDADGIVRLRHAGPLTKDVIDNKLIPALVALDA